MPTEEFQSAANVLCCYYTNKATLLMNESCGKNHVIRICSLVDILLNMYEPATVGGTAYPVGANWLPGLGICRSLNVVYTTSSS